MFTVILVASLTGFAVSLYVLEVGYRASYSGGDVSDMMRRMMGGQGGMVMPQQAAVPVYLWVLPTVFAGVFLLGAGGLMYFLLFPEIKRSVQAAVPVESASAVSVFKGEKVSALLSTMKPEERRVFEVLASHGGKYLQKHISKEADLSRLKTHRIIARFAERGIVTVRPLGNTNEVEISSWILSEK